VLVLTEGATSAWITQQARNLLMDLDGKAEMIKFLIRDRDTKPHLRKLRCAGCLRRVSY
jgi:putative transposase